MCDFFRTFAAEYELLRLMRTLCISFLTLLLSCSALCAQEIDFNRILAQAKAGDKVAQYNMGVYYTEVETDYKQAVKWYRKSAKQGYMYAQFNLGHCYEKGQGVKVNFEEAAAWYEKAAAQGDAFALNNLGNLYHRGDGVKKNLKKAFKLYQKAAQMGHAPAQYNLGYCYYLGTGVKQSTETALQWFQAAADQGVTYAQDMVDHIREHPTTLRLQFVPQE